MLQLHSRSVLLGLPEDASLPVERTHSAPCAAAMGYKGVGYRGWGIRMGVGGRTQAGTGFGGDGQAGGGDWECPVEGPEEVGQGGKGTWRQWAMEPDL